MNKLLKKFLIIDAIFLIIYLVFKFFPLITEYVYSKTIFPVITLILGFITDLFVFSLTEVLVILFFLFLFILPFWIIVYAVKKKITLIKTVFLFLRTYFMVLSVVIIWFYTIWGFNYFRKPLLNSREAAIGEEQFDRTTRFIISRANELYTVNDLSKKNTERMVYRELHSSVKKLINRNIYPARKIKYSFTNTMENTNTSGMISPFLLESHLSKELIPSEFPSIMAHEKSHLYGIANETEANFTAFYTCTKSENRFIRYSGYFEVLSYFLGRYRSKHTEEKYKKLYFSVRKEIRDEFIKQKKRYEKHKSKLNDMILDAYDVYLKSNNIAQGSKAYSQVVQMIITSNILEDEMKDFK